MTERLHVDGKPTQTLTYGERLEALKALALSGEEVDPQETQALLDDLRTYDANRMMVAGSRGLGDETQATINFLTGLLPVSQ